jgi:threonine dehydrogenase-like Zn-dependent dehydrogenase
LIWGGSSSVGQYALQILRHWGYKNLLATASKPHHELLKSFGARAVFDYRDPDVVKQIVDAASGNVRFVLDCIGSKFGSLQPIAKIARKGARVAVLLPVIVRDASDAEAPVYSMDVESEAEWAEGVETRGVRTHFYLDVSDFEEKRRTELMIAKNEFFKEHLQSEIMPTLLAEGVVVPNKIRIVQGKTLLERAQTAMDIMRRKQQSGERLVWRIADEE